MLSMTMALENKSKKNQKQLGGRPPPDEDDSTGSEDIGEISWPKKRKNKTCHWTSIAFCVLVIILLLTVIICLILNATLPAFNAQITQAFSYIFNVKTNIRELPGIKPKNYTTPAVDHVELNSTQFSTTTTISTTTSPIKVELTKAIEENLVLPERKNTALAIIRPIPYTVFPFQKDNHPIGPILTAEKVAGKYIYDFFSESVSYETSVEFCRQLGRGSRLLSIESNDERRSIDAYINGYQDEMFKTRKNRFVWTGGYFDLESDQPYELRWIDYPKSNVASTGYRNFCPESSNIQVLIDMALMNIKLRLKDNITLNPCDRRWVHVISDYRGHRISHSCWQIIERDILTPDEWKLPFVCKR